MAIADTITSMYGNVGNAYNVLALAGADLTNINKNLVNLTPTWKERLLYFMNNGTNEVWNNWTKVTGSGTEITLNNTEEAPMSLTYKGNTSQSGTPTPSSPIPVQVVSGDNSIEVVGKNLINLQATQVKRENATYSNITVSNNTLSFEVTGSRSGYVGYIVPTTIGQNYVLSFNLAKGFIYTIELDNVISDISGNFGLERTTPYTYTATKQYLGVWLSGGNTTDNQASVSNLMLEKGNQATTYEAYKSASYPINLPEGRNLFNIYNFTTMNGATWTIFKNTVNVKCTNLTTDGISNIININTNTDYILSGETISGATSRVALQFRLNSSSGWENYTIVKDNIGSFSKDFNSGNYTQMRVLLYSNFTTQTTYVSTSYSNIMLRISGTSSNYEEYGVTPIKLCKIGTYQDKIDKSTGRNLCGYGNTLPYTNGGVTLTRENGYYKTTGTTSSVWFYKNVYTIPAGTLNGTYKVKKIVYSGTSVAGIRIIDRTISPAVTYVETDASQTFTISNNNDLSVEITVKLNFASNETFNFILQKSTETDETYEPYGTNWYLKKEIGKVVLNENSNVGVSVSTNYSTCYLSDLLNVATTTSSSVGYSNYFKINYNNVIGNAYFTSSKYLYMIMDTSINNSTTFKTWLGTHNTEVYYVLATPTYETITDTTLIGQLEALKKSYESVTNISQTNNDLPFELDVVALSK